MKQSLFTSFEIAAHFAVACKQHEIVQIKKHINLEFADAGFNEQRDARAIINNIRRESKILHENKNRFSNPLR